MFRRAVERFLLLPDLQQGEQLCRKHRITVSIIDFFNSCRDLGNPVPGSLENLISEVEYLLSWKLVLSGDVCLIDMAIISPERRHILKETASTALVRSLVHFCNSSLAQIKKNADHVDPDLQPSFV